MATADIRRIVDKVLPVVDGERLDELQVVFGVLMEAAIAANGDPRWFADGKGQFSPGTLEVAERMKARRA